ncbi:hypothetical protein DPMN_037397 [Dreissena polymorpha]|uniref:Uncharacterized protein n=1 Tax=Dreissena polymorpha TaxID=45954 RepID=A0A9D4RPS5_DREPO|nr:hypothetical protein DPMN_037397 [Dreissena polymorpha]
MFWICGKNNLFRVLDQMRLLYPEEYDFYPRTWYLPDEFHQLAHDIKKINDKRKGPKATFIIKPDSGSQGEGIYLIRDVTDFITDKFNPGRMHVCQEYLADVFLIDKFKFDLRVYTVLKSADPLEFYICKEGLARFSTLPYENPTNKNIHEAFMHLTNYSLNKKSATFNRSEREDEGSKRTLTSVFNRLKRMGHNTDKLWKKIEHMVVKTMIAILPDLKIELQNALPANKPGPSCFQVKIQQKFIMNLVYLVMLNNDILTKVKTGTCGEKNTSLHKIAYEAYLYYRCHIFMSPTIVVGDILFLPCLSVGLLIRWSVCLFAPTLTFCNNFCYIEDSNFIFCMHMYLMKLHILSGERSRSRSSFKVRGQIYVAKIAHFMNTFAILKIAT